MFIDIHLFFVVFFHIHRQVFDAKLRAVREDIAAIEDSSNSLERTARNNTALLNSLTVSASVRTCGYGADP